MICCNHTNTSLYFSSVEEISDTIWEQLGCTKEVYFSKKYLSALAENNPQITFAYLVLVDENKLPTAFATLQVVDFFLDSVRNDLELAVRRIKNIGRKLGVIPDKKPFKLLTCGNTFVSGEHGIFIKENQDKKKVVKELAKAILHFVSSNAVLNKEINAFMLKDFIKESLFITDELHDYNYSSFNVEPNMVLNLDKNWSSFDDYLAAMKTKFRVKAKKALKVSSDIKIEEVTTKNIAALLPKMTELYKKVSANAGFNLGDFNLQTYKTLKENLGDAYILRAYLVDNKLVGFLSGMINQHTLDAHFVGIDYSKNREYAIYQRMLYDYIQIALDNKLSTINFGRTASDIKSSVGAIPQDLTIYLRHKNSIPNRLLSIFLKRIEPTPFHQKHPFKTEKVTLS
ncbi:MULTISPECIES: peptidogalycan biosysnthesis protein [Tenacibaculum]|uniref:peptidogalycan biosysnthesis protein n=1 Tax=Tenacibaculum TaxID=104267 RepID=UPI001F0A2F9E|nr:MULTISPECIES: peptidogalycan biosysnthesis protein [Tenacibaculum]MCH3881524.1 GNAT family N-acetyltransferase [Tenacibaculum aquimarinum]MDO6598881.1 GNAT family N-acetyltransferase [Tenacibaculum sp. 1_MG-2023]